jgi:uncharacterized protein YhaN
VRIARIEAIAYGAIAGRVIEPGPDLTVVHGPNESGKSSTMDLIRGVLFGFPALRRDGSAPLREPRGGGQRAGRIDLVDADGRRIVVERTHGSAVRVTGADGDPVGEAALSRALGIADRALFDQVQSFDAVDLARIDLLDDPAVRAGVLASAVLGAGGGAGPVLKDLRERADALYLRSGENQPYAHALRRVKDARRVLREVEAEAAALATAEDGLAEATERVARAEADLAEAARARDALRRRLELRAAIERVAELQAAAPSDAPAGAIDPERASALRALAGEVPAAEEARRRAERHRREAVEARDRSGAERARLGLAADAAVPTIAEEAPLREAAEAAEQAAREATRLAEAAAAVEAAPARPLGAAPVPRRSLGLGILVAGLAAVVAGMLMGLAPVWAIGLVVALAGGLVASGAVGASAGPHREDPALQGEAERRRAEAEAAARARDEARTGWAAALAACGVADPLRPDQLADLLAGFAQVREAERLAARAAQAAADEDAADRRIRERAAEALAAAGVEAPADAELLGARIDEALRVLDEAMAESARHAAQVEAHRLEHEAAQAEVPALGGDDSAAAAAAAALDPAAAEADLEVAEARIAWLRDEELAEANRALGGVKALAERAGESADVPAAAQALADAEADLRDIADRWLTVRLAHDVLARARDRFVEEHQPGVLRRAAEQIAVATGGAWTEIRMPDGERAGARSEIIGRAGARIPFTELSQGTVGLVYLCLRAGLVDEMRAAGGVELPVIMDDVLTHLDPERRAGGARVIADLATRHQVVYFTCHDEQVGALAAASPGCVDWPLERLV